MAGKFLSRDEKIVEEMDNFYLTTDRVIKYKKGGGNTDYRDIQLDKIVSFDYSRDFNKLLFMTGLLAAGLGLAVSTSRETVGLGFLAFGILSVLWSFFTSSKEYKIRSDNEEVAIDIPHSDYVFDFWKEINNQRNH